MSVVLTVRGVPEHTRDMLAREASHRGQSLQAYLLSLLQQHARFAENRQLLWDIQEEFDAEGDGGITGTTAAEAIRRERERLPPIRVSREPRPGKAS